MKSKNLFVVDWKKTSDDEIKDILKSDIFLENEWEFYNCLSTTIANKGVLNRYKAYVRAAKYILLNKKKYNNIIIWQQQIGIILSFFPRFHSSTKIIVTTLLYSPSRVGKNSFRSFLLKNVLKKSDALLYFSNAMAEDVKVSYPHYSRKVFSTYMPIVKSKFALKKNSETIDKDYSVFSGGLSDRDFDVIIKAFTGTNTKVTIVCTNQQVIHSQELITDNIKIIRDVSEKEYYSLALASSIVIITLKTKFSSCGQLLFSFCMQNSIPIIATDCYGTQDYITHNENGILVPVNDHTAIYNAYIKLKTDEIFRNFLIENSLAISSKMTFSNFLIKIDQIINQLP